MLLAFVLSFVKLCWPLWEICHTHKIKITYTPHIPAAPTLGVGAKTYFPSRFTQKNVLLLYWEWTQNMLDRFFIHQINDPGSCCCLSKFCCRKETWGYAKVIQKMRRRKNGQVSEISKTMGTQMLAWKKEMNKIAPVL